MSIATELQRIKQAKEALKQAINAKGGTLTDEKLDAYSNAVEDISTDTDTSDATVTADKLLDGVTAYGAEGKVTGNIPTVTASLTGNTVTVPSGYIAEVQEFTVETDTDTSTASAGYVMWKNGSLVFVNLTDGTQEMVSTLYIPKTGLIPEYVGFDDTTSGTGTGVIDGLVFSAPLASNYTDIVTNNNALQATGNFTTYLGKQCLHIGESELSADPRSIWKLPEDLLPPTGEFTLFFTAAWESLITSISNYPIYPLCYFGEDYDGTNANNKGGGFRVEKSDDEEYIGELFWGIGSGSNNFVNMLKQQSWSSFAITRNSDDETIAYCNSSVDTGSIENHRNKTLNFNKLCIAGIIGNSSGNIYTRGAYYADLRMYNRALSAEEITALHNTCIPQ